MNLHAGCACHYTVAEETNAVTICAEILFIGGSTVTTKNLSVSLSTSDITAIGIINFYNYNC